MAGDTKCNGYPQRASLIADLCGLWKAARRPLPTELRTSILDGEGWDVLYRLANRLMGFTGSVIRQTRFR